MSEQSPQNPKDDDLSIWQVLGIVGFLFGVVIVFDIATGGGLVSPRSQQSKEDTSGEEPPPTESPATLSTPPPTPKPEPPKSRIQGFVDRHELAATWACEGAVEKRLSSGDADFKWGASFFDNPSYSGPLLKGSGTTRNQFNAKVQFNYDCILSGWTKDFSVAERVFEKV